MSLPSVSVQTDQGLYCQRRDDKEMSLGGPCIRSFLHMVVPSLDTLDASHPMDKDRMVIVGRELPQGKSRAAMLHLASLD